MTSASIKAAAVLALATAALIGVTEVASATPPTCTSDATPGVEWECLGSSTGSSVATTATPLANKDAVTGISYSTAISPFTHGAQISYDDQTPFIDFNSASIDSISQALSSGRTVYIEFTEINIDDPHLYKVKYTLNSAVTKVPTTWTVSEQAYWDPSNHPFALSDPLSAGSFTPTSADFSLTEVYKFTIPAHAGSIGTFNGGITVEGAMVPEASTWAMLGLGFAVVGLFGVSKRRKEPRSIF